MQALYYTFILIGLLCVTNHANAQPLQRKVSYTQDDSLRGTLNAERSWWNVQHYALSVEPDHTAKTVTGTNTISFTSTNPKARPVMQIDLQSPMKIDSVLFEGRRVGFERRGKDSWLVQLGERSVVKKKIEQSLTIYFRRQAIHNSTRFSDGSSQWPFDKQEYCKKRIAHLYLAGKQSYQ
jgi:hypothetical protein